MKHRKRHLLTVLLSAGMVLSGCNFDFFGLFNKNQNEQKQDETEYVNITAVNGSGSGSYLKGSTVTLVTSNQEGYMFVGWKTNGEIVSTSLTYSFVANKSGIYEATFSKIDDPVAVTIVVQGGSGSGSYNVGSTVTLTATPQEGKVFEGWELNGSIVSTQTSYTFTATISGTYIAKFKDEETSSKVQIVVNGGSGSGSYDIGENVTITTTAQEGKTFIGWLCNGNIVSNQLSYTFTVTGAATYTATFVEGGIENYEKGKPIKRIYTVEEANKVAGKKNTRLANGVG